MGEKFMAGVLTAVVITPMCSVCILGPAVVGSFFGGLAGWFSGFDPVVTTGLAIAIAFGFIAMMKKRSPGAAQSKSDTAILHQQLAKLNNR